MAVDMGSWFSDMAPSHAQASMPVTDLSPHVDGGQTPGTGGSNAASAPDEKMVLHLAAAMVLGALVLLWLMGGVVFRSARL